MATTKYFGKYKSRVTQVYDEKEERARIKVKCPAVLGEAESNWCEPMFAYAKDEEGDYYLPKIDETIMVEFFDGDPNKPIWFGNWYSEFKTPIITARNKQPDHEAGPLNDYSSNHDQVRIINFEKGWIVIHREYMRIYFGDSGDTELYTNYDEFYLERNKGKEMRLYSNDDVTFLRRYDSQLIMVDEDTQLFKDYANIKLTAKDIIVKAENITFNIDETCTINAKNIKEIAQETIINTASKYDEDSMKQQNVNTKLDALKGMYTAVSETEDREGKKYKTTLQVAGEEYFELKTELNGIPIPSYTETKQSEEAGMIGKSKKGVYSFDPH